MKWYSTIVYAIGIAFSVALALFPKTAPAQEVQVGRGIVCDRADQVTRILKADDFQATLVAVNAEKALSCAVLPVAFIFHGDKGETVRIHGASWQVQQILVLGLETDEGMRPVEPTIQWSAFYVDEQGA
jgi:hypothetical protein